MDSEMYVDFQRVEKKTPLQHVFLPLKKSGGDGDGKELEALQKILKIVEGLEGKILNGVKEQLQLVIGGKQVSVEAATPGPTAVSIQIPALTESIADITQLLSDVESLKKEMEEAEWKRPPADVIDGLISDVKDLKADREKKFEASSLTEGSLETLQSKVIAKLKVMDQRIDDLQEEMKDISSNLGNLFTFVYAKEHGRGMRLKGGWVDDRFVIQALKPKST